MESTDLKNPNGLKSRQENLDNNPKKITTAIEHVKNEKESVKAEDESSRIVLETEAEVKEPVSTAESEEATKGNLNEQVESEPLKSEETFDEVSESTLSVDVAVINKEENLMPAKDDNEGAAIDVKFGENYKVSETVADKVEVLESVLNKEELKDENDDKAIVNEPEVTIKDSEPVDISETNVTATDISETDDIDSSLDKKTDELLEVAENESGLFLEGEEEETEKQSNNISDEKSEEKDKRTDKKIKKLIAVPISGSQKQEKPAYNSYSQIELVNALREILDSNGEHDIREEVESIKAAFYKKVKDEEEEQIKQFQEEYGEEEEFIPEPSPYEQDIKDLLKRYRQIRHDFNKKLEEEKEINLQLKYDIIEEIKNLINKEESINKTFQEFRDLQLRWREIGLVPQSKMKDLWNNYHFHVENFYDYIKINKELRDLDLKKNLEMKIRLCEQSEELLLEPNTVKAFNLLQKLHERWREIGPVPHENKDDIWERFKIATSKINKKHQDHFEYRKTEQKKNLDAKRALCEQIEEINETELITHKDWADKSKEVVNLQKVWRTIGFATQKENNRIYKRFRQACDKFFDDRRIFYSKNKELQQNNLQMKTELCLQAEALKDSIDWHKTTQDLISIQKQWKEIGPVPRKHSDILWKRFRAACDYFFEKKTEHFSAVDFEQDDNLKEKEQLINEIENYKSTGNADENLKNLKEFQRKWMEIGHVPIKKKDDTQKRFRDAINKLFDELKIDDSKRDILRFKSKMATFLETSRGQNKMRLERDKYMTRLKQLENDLVLLDNNIGFFTKSKNAETLIKDVKRQIEQTKEKIGLLKEKIRLIDEMDHSDE